MNINAVRSLRQRLQAEVSRKPIREIIGTQLQAASRNDEVKVEGGIADPLEDLAELLEGSCFHSHRGDHFNALAKVERFEGGLLCPSRVKLAVIAHYAEEINPQVHQRNIIADIKASQPLGQLRPVARGENPLREIARETFCQEVVTAEAPKRVIKDGRIAALLEPNAEFREPAGFLVADARHAARGDKAEGLLGYLQAISSPSLFRKLVTSAGSRRKKQACVCGDAPTRTVRPRRSSANADSSAVSSPT